MGEDNKNGRWIRYDRNGEIAKAAEFKNGREIRITKKSK